MATDGPTPPNCDGDIFLHGEIVLTTDKFGGSNAIESFVKRVAEVSGQRVDWHFLAGWVVVKALGDIPKVRWTLQQLEDVLAEMRTSYRQRLYASVGFDYQD